MFFISVACGQEKFTDPRDGRIYEITKVGSQTWFSTNLQYGTTTSWCTEVPDSEACLRGNFYYYTDLDSVCPTGWRVPDWEDYKTAFEFIANSREDSVVWTHGLMPSEEYEIAATFILGLHLTDNSPPLHLIATGWIQGNKWFDQKKKSMTTLWVAEENSGEKPQPHLHIDHSSVVRHAHAHNILDKPKKQRRFSVRCVLGTQ